MTQTAVAIALPASANSPARLGMLLSGRLLLGMLLLVFPRPGLGDESTIAARVNGREVTIADVEQQMRMALGDRPIEQAVLTRLRRETLRKLVDRELVLLFLEGRQLAATPEDIELAVQRLTEELQVRERTLDDYLQDASLTEDQLRRTLRWTLSWRHMLDTYMTEENIERYFNANRRQFDGTQLRVAHILWKVDGDASDALNKAHEVREQILARTIQFSDAAKMYSQAPTANAGGDIGWIERHAPMPESFSAAAFQLEPQQVSAPVVTAAGVHLIQCLEVKSGQLAWREVRRELQPAVAEYLFQWAADRQRASAQIEWTDAIPDGN